MGLISPITVICFWFIYYKTINLVKASIGISAYMIEKYVGLSRLPEKLKTAIKNGSISPNDRTAENSAIRAVNALKWVKGGDVDVDKVLDLAVEYAKGDIPHEVLTNAAKKGGSIKNIKDNAMRQKSTDIPIHLSTEVAEKLNAVAENTGVKVEEKATAYVVQGTRKDYAELED